MGHPGWPQPPLNSVSEEQRPSMPTVQSSTGGHWDPLLGLFSELAGAGPCSRVSSTCLGPADTRHKFTRGRAGMGEAGRPRCSMRGQITVGKECPAHSPPWVYCLPGTTPSSCRAEAFVGLKIVGRTPGLMPSTDPLVGWPQAPYGGELEQQEAQTPRREQGAFAERQRHLAAGGTPTRLLLLGLCGSFRLEPLHGKQ